MTAESVTGIGPGSAEGPLRGYDLDNIRKVYINQSGNLLPCITILGHGGGEKYVLRAVGDGQVKVSSIDQVPGYLLDKLVPGTNITFNVSGGPDQTITINASGGGSSIPAVVSINTYTCPAGAAVGNLVYVNGANSVGLANATSNLTAPAFGVVYSKPTATTCQVAYYGEVSAYVGLTPGIPYYLDTVNGGISSTAPSGSNNVLQPVGTPRSSTTLVFNPQNYIIL